MRIYGVYIRVPKTLFELKFKYIIANSTEYILDNDYYIGLYGYCKKKSMLKNFLDSRKKSIFSIREEDIDEFDLQHSSEYKNLEIICASFKTYDEASNKIFKTDITVVKNEKISCTEFPIEYLNEMYPATYADLPVSIFNKKIIDCLEILGYASRYYSDYGDSEMQDLTDFNESYYLSPSGFTLITKNSPDQLGFLLYLYKYTFFGYDNMGEVLE